MCSMRPIRSCSPREAVDEREQTGGAGQRAPEIEPWPGVTRVGGQQQEDAGHRDCGEDEVDVQAPAPREVLGEKAANQQPLLKQRPLRQWPSESAGQAAAPARHTPAETVVESFRRFAGPAPARLRWLQPSQAP